MALVNGDLHKEACLGRDAVQLRPLHQVLAWHNRRVVSCPGYKDSSRACQWILTHDSLNMCPCLPVERKET